MTQDEIIEMAREVGIKQDGDMWFSNLYKTDVDVHISHLEAFAKLVAAKEREACARLCDELAVHPEYASEVTKLAALVIRARDKYD
jgi:hypothetical protein